MLIPIYLLSYNCAKQNITRNGFVDKFVLVLPLKPCNFYVFALQEMCDIMEGSFYDLANHYAITYNDALLQALSIKFGNDDYRFKTVAIVHTGAIALIVISPYFGNISDVKTATAAHGYGFSSLKGGVGVRFTYKPSPSQPSVEFTFGGAHLPANEGNNQYLYRNMVCRSVMRAMDFGDGHGLLKPGSHTFFMGDLNYRTTEKYNPISNETQKLLKLQDLLAQDIDEIADLVSRYDELYKGMARGEVLMGFAEAPITFRPTYKYELNTAIYNAMRSPLWCDRIVYQGNYAHAANDRVPVSVHKYDALNNLLDLDHRPVYLHITVPITPPDSLISRGGFQLLVAGTASDDVTLSPTNLYMKPTQMDHFVNWVIRPLSDGAIGYGLWISTTKNGRLTILALVILGALWRLI